MGFMPDWVLGSTCGMGTNKYVIGEISLQAYTNKFSKDLLQKYEDATSDKLMSITEEMMQFLTSLENSDAILINNAYIFNQVNFDESGAKRKMKTLFKSAFAPQKKEISIETVHFFLKNNKFGFFSTYNYYFKYAVSTSYRKNTELLIVKSHLFGN